MDYPGIFQQAMLETKHYIEMKQQEPEPPTVIGIVKLAATTVKVKISSIKKMTIGRVQE
jgi:hypothetical protein